jgi:Holliday junction DNA helicase RuvA
MITRVQGVLESIEGNRAVLAPLGAGVAYEILLPAFLAVELAPGTGKTVTLCTLQYLEGQGQGTSYIPRLVGFESALQREFFEVFTGVNGIGNRRALRAMTLPPRTIARAIEERDAKLLATLPEVGKRMAERILAELDGKVAAFIEPSENGVGLSRIEQKPMGQNGTLSTPAMHDAVEALIALGESRYDAEEKVRRAVRNYPESAKSSTPDKILERVFSG